ncbi:hypothetical protein CB0940_04374 [Cercospora beticola]|uniref:Ecp2 effector protein domain-containing protein n=1 Tax=Cercospora beticola TaxID=122368 RepID=A0A2G5HMF7_CERBT|nr:hypothetical protein CB0940_04374 [Cercospora beticola]PIA93688.1 hypothetical protein CB0940_04374 [Cercospora beticola]WPB01609.1 hypothetical protein RHO25_006238 [Cercospora beticola]CAK1363591.1 unnamed protein product [Cercospora beticola]
MKLAALSIVLGTVAAIPLAIGEEDSVVLSVLSHDNFIAETTCSWSSKGNTDKTKPCLNAIIKNLTQDFLAAYQEASPVDQNVDAPRSVQQGNAQFNVSGIVGNFYWLSLSSEAYDHFNKSPATVELIASSLSDYVLEYNATEICVDFSTGKAGRGDIIANGVMTFGWGLEPFYYADPTLLERRLKQDCQIGNMRMYATHYREVPLV